MKPESLIVSFKIFYYFKIGKDLYCKEGFPGGSWVKNPPANAEDAGLIPGLGRSLEKEMTTTSVFLPGKSHGLRSLEG